MVAIPMRLEDALRLNGFTIDQSDFAATTITVPTGIIAIPALRLSSLTWARPGSPEPSDSFYLAALPVFDVAYRDVALSNVLDRFSTRRISYDTLDMFGLAVRRWMNRDLGPTSVLNRRYLSTAVNLPLTTQDGETAITSSELARDAYSDLPQGQLSGDKDYATSATDRAASDSSSTVYTGRMGVSVMELLEAQRAAYLNVDAELLDAMEPLFLGVWDQDESEPPRLPSYPGALGFPAGRW